MGKVKYRSNPYFLDWATEWMMVIVPEMGILHKEMVV